MKKIWFIFLALFFTGCVNWKARAIMYKSQLENCQQAREEVRDTVEHIIIKDLPEVDVPPSSVQLQDTLIIHTKEIQKILFKPKLSFRFEKDSVKIYMILKNKVISGRLIQKIKVDSVKYPKFTRVITRTIPVPDQIQLEKERYKAIMWRNILFGSYFLLFLVSIIIWRLRR